MPFPVSPEEFKNLLPTPTGRLCQKLVSALLAIPAALYRIISWGVNSDLSASDALKAWLGLASGSLLQAPTNLVATNAADHIDLNWSNVAAATSYDVYFSLSPTPPTVGVDTPLVAGLATNSFTYDASVASTPSFAVGTQYYFWTVARNGSAVSGLSNMVVGVAGGVTSPALFYGSPSAQTFISPINGNIDIVSYGAGAAGGAAYNTTGPFGGLIGANGGGGGGGEKRTLTLAVIIGSVITLGVGKGGVGSSSIATGQAGGSTTIAKDGVLVLEADGGNGGKQGGAPTGFPGPIIPGSGPPGAGGLGGSGGQFGTPTSGNDGDPGTTSGGGDGADGLAPDLKGAGGQGGSNGGPGASGQDGYVEITW